MAIDDVLCNELHFRWDDASNRLVVSGRNRQNALLTVAEIDYATLDQMTWTAASKFIGEFVTLLVPTLRSRYSAEFADAEPSANDKDA